MTDVEKEMDEEAARWQRRIEETIRRYGLEPIDASGNESGDPLDWSTDQISAALGDLSDQLDALKEAVKLGRFCHSTHCHAQGCLCAVRGVR